MKLASNISGALLGLAFIVFGTAYFFVPMPPDPSPADAPHKLFMGAFVPTGYMAFVKALEIIGGLLTAVPRTRNAGLLILGPIIVNILAFHTFVMKGATLADPVSITIAIAAVFLLWADRRTWCGLVCGK